MTTYQPDPGDGAGDDDLGPEPTEAPGRHDGVMEDPASDGPRETAGLRPLVAADAFESRWSQIQIGFVDRPRSAVQSAGTLVAELMDELARAVEAELAALDSRTSSGEGQSTEDLRVAFQRYRELFDRLAAA